MTTDLYSGCVLMYDLYETDNNPDMLEQLDESGNELSDSLVREIDMRDSLNKRFNSIDTEELRHVRQNELLFSLFRLQNSTLAERGKSTCFFQVNNLGAFLYDAFSAADLTLCARGQRLFIDGEFDISSDAVFEISSVQTAVYDMLYLALGNAPEDAMLHASFSRCGSFSEIRISSPLRSGIRFPLSEEYVFKAIKKAAQLHGGKFSIYVKGDELISALTVSRHLKPDCSPSLTTPPDFNSLLCNRLSAHHIWAAASRLINR